MKSKLIGSFAITMALIAGFYLGQSPAVAQNPAREGAAKKAGPTPRLPDGKPDLGNGKGVWYPRAIHDISGTGGDPAQKQQMVEKPVPVEMLPWAKEVYEQRGAVLFKDDPEGFCQPPGVPRMMTTPFAFQIYQQPDRILFIYEGGAHIWRMIYMDGRQHPKDPNPSFLGDSIGHWEGDTLVVDVVGFNDKTWIDAAGHPHTEDMHVVERFQRTDELTMRYTVTIEDPKTYVKPWTTTFTIPFRPGWDPFEYICQENNKDLAHLIGK